MIFYVNVLIQALSTVQYVAAIPASTCALGRKPIDAALVGNKTSSRVGCYRGDVYEHEVTIEHWAVIYKPTQTTGAERKSAWFMYAARRYPCCIIASRRMRNYSKALLRRYQYHHNRNILPVRKSQSAK